METIAIQSTSARSAVCSDIVIRVGEKVRLVFRPEIVDNPQEPKASVKGRFLYQRKSASEPWEDFDKQPLSSLRSGEQFQLEIKSGELLPFLHELAALYRLHRVRGIPQGRLELVKIGQHLAKLLEFSEQELDQFLAANSDDAIRTLRRVLGWLSRSSEAARQLADGDKQLSDLNALIGLTNLRTIQQVWQDNCLNPDEEFWQRMLAQHAFVLSQLLAYPVVVIKGKAYVGGKRVDNAHGNLVDFLGRVGSSGAAVLIEIKTPETRLLGSEYRQDVFPPSVALTGAISQVLHYRESLMQELHTLLQDQQSKLTGAEPRCVIIAGSANRELRSESQKRSFERFRERVVGVTLLTFDELFGRVAGLISLFENPED